MQYIALKVHIFALTHLESSVPQWLGVVVTGISSKRSRVSPTYLMFVIFYRFFGLISCQPAQQKKTKPPAPLSAKSDREHILITNERFISAQLYTKNAWNVLHLLVCFCFGQWRNLEKPILFLMWFKRLELYTLAINYQIRQRRRKRRLRSLRKINQVKWKK